MAVPTTTEDPRDGDEPTAALDAASTAGDHERAGATRDTLDLVGLEGAELHATVLETLVRASDSLTEGFDVQAMIDDLVAASHRLVERADVGVILADEQGGRFSAGASNEAVQVLDQYQMDRGSGPSIEAMRTAAAVPDERFDSGHYPWPDLGRLARAIGYVSMCAVPLARRSEVIGVMTIAQTTGTSRSRMAESLLQVLADTTAIGIINRRTLAASHELSRQLQEALTSRITIEQAKGVVAAQLGLSIDDAFETLRRYARGTHRKVIEISRAVLDGAVPASHLRRAPGAAVRDFRRTDPRPPVHSSPSPA